MTYRITTMAAAMACFATGVGAQQASGQMAMPTPFELPEACRAAAQSGGQMASMPPQMQGMMNMMAGMSEGQKGLHEAMMKMDPPMMTGMMAKDVDVAWACSMIPHHMGALEMSRVVLKYGNNAEAKRMAEKTIRDQEKDIADLKTWVEKSAKK